MGRPNQKAHLMPLVESYIVRAMGDPDVPLSVRAVATAIGCSPQTLYSHGFNDRITAAGASRGRIENRIKRRRSKRTDAMLIEDLRVQVADWQQKYENLLQRLTLLEYNLRSHPTVDVNELYSRQMPHIDRPVPAPRVQTHGYTRR